ncbi:MAG: HAD family hydrolase [Opitutales bacterium]
MNHRMLEDVRAVCFDVGNTLLEVHPSVGVIYAEILAELGYPAPLPALIDARFPQAFKSTTEARTEQATSEPKERAFWQAVVAQTLPPDFTRPVPETVFDALWTAFESKRYWRPLPGAVETLEILTGYNVPLAILSNWDRRLHPLLKELGWTRFFRYVGISSEIGWSKPAPKAFAAIAEALGLEPRTICHVGDSYSADIEGAHGADFQSLWVQPDSAKAQARNCPAIASLAELPQRLALEDAAGLPCRRRAKL